MYVGAWWLPLPKEPWAACNQEVQIVLLCVFIPALFACFLQIQPYWKQCFTEKHSPSTIYDSLWRALILSHNKTCQSKKKFSYMFSKGLKVFFQQNLWLSCYNIVNISNLWKFPCCVLLSFHFIFLPHFLHIHSLSNEWAQRSAHYSMLQMFLVFCSLNDFKRYVRNVLLRVHVEVHLFRWIIQCAFCMRISLPWTFCSTVV